MSGLLLGIVLSVCICWFHNMVTLPPWLVSTDFGTCSYQCFLSNFTPASLHMLKCSCAHTLSCLLLLLLLLLQYIDTFLPAHATQAFRGWRVSSFFFSPPLWTRLRWVTNFTPRLLYPRANLDVLGEKSVTTIGFGTANRLFRGVAAIPTAPLLLLLLLLLPVLLFYGHVHSASCDETTFNVMLSKSAQQTPDHWLEYLYLTTDKK